MIVIEIKTENAAFDNNLYGEVSRILRKLADRLDRENILFHGSRLIDINGNIVGNVTLN